MVINFDFDCSDFGKNLPDISDEDNPLIWCERCQRKHKKYTFTRSDFERVKSEAGKTLADEIDRRALEYVYEQIRIQK